MSKEQEPADDEEVYMLSPKGSLSFILMDKFGVDYEDEALEEVWDGLQAFCMRCIKEDFPDAEFPAIVFNGAGGIVVGIDSHQETS